MKKIPKPEVALTLPPEAEAAASQAGSFAGETLEEVSGFEVYDPTSYSVAAETLVAVKTEYARIKKLVDFLVGPLKEHVRRVESMFRPALKDLEEVETRLKSEVATWRKEAPQVRRQHLKNAEGAQSESERVLWLRNAELCDVPDVPGVSGRRNRQLRIVDEAAVPEKFWRLVLDEDAIKAALESGEEVPGVEVETSEIIAVRILKNEDKK